MDTTIELTEGESEGPPMPPPKVGRYQAVRQLGQGTFGAVWEARDTVTNEQVALKVLHALRAGQRASVRREVTALRWARLPGVVRIRDDGESGVTYFIAMDLVAGRPFPGRPEPCGWDDLITPAVHLMGIVARMHFVGLVHRDLKPANVLVDEAGRVSVVDLGIARPMDEALDGFEGTVAYASPEQFSGRGDGRSDVYSVGLMLFRALTGIVPHTQHASVLANVTARRKEPAPPIASLVSGLPASVSALIDRMLSVDPEDRPSSLVEVLERLGSEPPLPVLPAALSAQRRVDEHALRALFAGPDRFLHLREDGARVLYERTGGYVDRVQRELAAWARSGRGYWVAGRMVLSRTDLVALEARERLRVGGATPALDADPRQALGVVRGAAPRVTEEEVAARLGWDEARCAASIEQLVAAALVWRLPGGRLGADLIVGAQGARGTDLEPPDRRLSWILRQSADHVPVGSLIDAVLQRAELDPSGAFEHVVRALEFVCGSAPEHAHRLLPALTAAALAQESIEPIHDALFWLGRAGGSGAALDDLLHAGLAIRSGDVAGGVALMDRVPPFSDWRVEVWRWGLRVEVARRQAADRGSLLTQCERALNDAPEWAIGYLRGWQGNHAYDTQRYLEAARLHAEASRLKSSPPGRISSLANGASALLEALRYDAARRQADRAIEAARALRHPAYEAYASWISRLARYRAGDPLKPDGEASRAAAAVSPTMGLLHTVLEASIALRLGDRARAREQVDRAVDLARQIGADAHLAIALGIGAATGAQLEARETAHCRAYVASDGPAPLRAQVYGLTHTLTGRSDPTIEADLRGACAGLDLDVRYDVLTLRECFEPNTARAIWGLSEDCLL